MCSPNRLCSAVKGTPQLHIQPSPCVLLPATRPPQPRVVEVIVVQPGKHDRLDAAPAASDLEELAPNLKVAAAHHQSPTTWCQPPTREHATTVAMLLIGLPPTDLTSAGALVSYLDPHAQLMLRKSAMPLPSLGPSGLPAAPLWWRRGVVERG